MTGEIELFSIIVPTLDEANNIGSALLALQPLRSAGAEIIVSDGGSSNSTLDRARGWCDTAIIAPRGRASQMNAGASIARGNILLFLHADTRLPETAGEIIDEVFRDTTLKWGRFDIAFNSSKRSLRIIAAFMNMRSRWSGIATGDQAIFVRSDTFKEINGFPDIPLMEDIALSKQLKRIAPPLCLRAKCFTSARRWEQNGLLSTVILMWMLRLAFWFGVNPSRLAAVYGYWPRDA